MATTQYVEIDDLWTASGKPYLVCPGGMETGALQFIDRHYTFGEMPGYLVDQTYIRTSGDDKMYEEDQVCLRFGVSCDVNVYVLHGMPFPARPRWLAAFRDTGDVVTRPLREDPRGMRFRVLVKTFPAGVVTLCGDLPAGMLTPQFRAAGGSGYCMYSVVVARV